ncbi:hypothetical protein [Kitasatospora cinereorecta]|uniref:Uncharacterized protein n=1 Tax=Kitasatospora cinereorecta TaxID=285560 RepID=A0ABW0V770_9ACTN
MELDISAQPGRAGNSTLLAWFTDIAMALSAGARTGGGSAAVSATLRNPYEYWSAEFTHHARRYSRRDLALAGALLKQAVESGRAERLGDLEWVIETVRRLKDLPHATRRSPKADVQHVLDHT